MQPILRCDAALVNARTHRAAASREMARDEPASADAGPALRLTDTAPTADAIRASALNETGRKAEAQADIKMARKLSRSPNVTRSP